MLKKSIFLLLLFCSLSTKAQDIQKIEQDLLVSFKQIGDWCTKTYDYDSLTVVNRNFNRKLLGYTMSEPLTLSTEFKALQNEGMNILTSPDKKLRIYSWHTCMGARTLGTETIFQYKGEELYSENLYNKDSLDEYGMADIGDRYRKIDMLSVGDRIIYLVPSTFYYSRMECHETIVLYEIKNDSLIRNVPIIKTKEGLTGNLGFDYTLSSLNNYTEGDILYDDKQQTITFPVVLEDGKVTSKQIVYQFNGEYFVKQK